MVKTSLAHFGEVAAASSALHAAGFSPVPHLPAARFAGRGELRAALRSLAGAGASSFLVVGGNDLGDRVIAGECAYTGGAQALLRQELGLWGEFGVAEVALAGHPDGHPALGWDAAATSALLVDKARGPLAEGLDVTVVSQFCFDARRLVRWLRQARADMARLEAELGEAAQLPGAAPSGAGRPTGRVRFRVGLPGPTPRKKLERIAAICEVPSLFVSSAFDLIDGDGDGFVSLEDMEGYADRLGLARQGSKLRSAYAGYAGPDGLLGQQQFCELLVDDAEAQQQLQSRAQPPQPAWQAEATFPLAVAPGPSKFVAVGPEVGGAADAVLQPQELAIALAAFCERERVPRGEVALHLFPFGGLPGTLGLVAALRDGSWPLLAGEGERLSSPRAASPRSLE